MGRILKTAPSKQNPEFCLLGVFVLLKLHPIYNDERINTCMEKNKQFFNMIEPSENLRSSILGQIRKGETKKAIYDMVFSSVLSLASISTIVIFAISITKDFYQSGLSEYFSLLFSDGSSILSYWQTYVMSLVESLPIIPITMIVASTSIFIWSMNKVVKDFKNTKLVFYKINY